MSAWAVRIFTMFTAVSLAAGPGVCPCLASGKHVGDALAPVVKQTSPARCPHCKPKADSSQPKQSDKPTGPCSHCKAMASRDREVVEVQLVDLKPGLAAILAGEHTVLVRDAIALARLPRGEDVPIPRLLSDLVHQSCQLTV